MDTQTLKRTIGFPMLTLYGLGTILGAGIYVLVGKVAASAGIYAPLSFLTAAILAALRNEHEIISRSYLSGCPLSVL